MLKKLLPLLLIFLIAFALRTYRLTEIPPGLTHDEANHGREAIEVLDGELRFYFPLNYGSEPAYSYTVAGAMLTLGERPFALRLVNVMFGIGAMALAYLWATHAFDRQTAVLAAGITAVSFWPLASSREALRAGMLPFFMTAAVWFFWRFVDRRQTASKRRCLAAAFGVSVAVTLHIYLAARVAWLMFPLYLLYLLLIHRLRFRRAWTPTLSGLLLAGLLVTPMFLYLRANPEALTRLDMLDRPLQDLRSLNLGPILTSAGEALLAFIWPGYGDRFLAYNIPGRPVFDVLTAVFFVAGVLVSAWRWRRPPYFFLLLWFGVGIIPSLLTGPTANTTRNLAALPAVHLLPAVGFMAVWRRVTGWERQRTAVFAPVAALWLLLAGWATARAYFVQWGTAPEVRNAYQQTLVAAVDYLVAQESTTPVVFSSVYPGPAHDPSVRLVLQSEPPYETRWVDARFALILPQGEDGRLLVPTSTPLHPVLADLVTPLNSVALRSDDLDPGFTLYRLDADALPELGVAFSPLLANFNDAVYLQDARWLQPTVAPGETAVLLTVWQVVDPARVGPIVPPFYETDVNLFTHVLTPGGEILTQRDTLEAPSWSWRTKDIIIQLHPVTVPAETPPGQYETAVGVYDKLSGERTPVVNDDGQIVGSQTAVTPLSVSQP